jgi:fumarylacetoacetase
MTWVDVPVGSDFPIQNLPYGIFSTVDGDRRVGVAIGDQVLDVSKLDVPYAVDLAQSTLNGFMSRGRGAWEAVRTRVTELLTDPVHLPAVQPHLLTPAVMHLPFDVADYVDFYASEHHASNVGRIFRPSGEPLTPNWKHLPIGYHGRAGTVVVSKTPVVRPSGQRKDSGDAHPSFGPCRRLDIEAEVGFVVGVASPLG